jgi:hypothetical protein
MSRTYRTSSRRSPSGPAGAATTLSRPASKTQQRGTVTPSFADFEDEHIDELLEVVRDDTDRTTRFIEGVLGASITLRGWAVTLWLGIVGFGVDQDRGALVALGIVIILAFGLVDAYNATLYGQALMHARRLEDIATVHHAWLSRGDDDPSAAAELVVRLKSFRPGLYSNLWVFRIKDLKYVRPRVFFRVFYPLMIALSAVIGVLVEWI